MHLEWAAAHFCQVITHAKLHGQSIILQMGRIQIKVSLHSLVIAGKSFPPYASPQQFDFQEISPRIGNSEPHSSRLCLSYHDEHHNKNIITRNENKKLLLYFHLKTSAPGKAFQLTAVLKEASRKGTRFWASSLHSRKKALKCVAMRNVHISLSPLEQGCSKQWIQIPDLIPGWQIPPVVEIVHSENFHLSFVSASFGKGDLLGQNRITWIMTVDPGILESQKIQPALGRLIIKLLGTIIKISSEVWLSNTEIQ